MRSALYVVNHESPFYKFGDSERMQGCCRRNEKSPNFLQTRMSVFGEEPLTGVLYQIPITFSTENHLDFDDTKPVIVMKDKNITLNKGTKDMEWVVFNKQQIGKHK